ncbi:LysR family transcriptional regulator [Vibrio ezurae]|uniref:Putative LysR family transcriptional regulator n=1 Tax=Vibrio ezurae NBRC 102218 TaxID=1219080 RepID=U3B5R7_9VIBR|nr:LysR family transcriptional regulator [Vibrio ezurae]GAD81270.1 putative LysR family transcriptional regulator [Vibrio ezurae NBRC 102218]
MDLNLLTTFLSVYHHKSITLASEELELSQPAISASLKRLEGVIGKALFVREGRGIVPTGAAVALANKIESPMSVLETIEGQQDHLNVYCSEAVLFKVAHIDNITIAETPLDEEIIIDDLYTQKVDLVIDAMSSKHQSLIVEEFHEEDAVCLTRLEHPRIKGQISLEQYFNEQHIALKVRRNNLNTLNHLSDKPVATRKIKIETGSVASMLAIASQTDFIASSSREIAEEFAQNMGLRIHEIPFELNRIKFNMIYHRRYINDAFHKAKREALRNAIIQRS